jgi:two-component system NtrC family sensor kinase
VARRHGLQTEILVSLAVVMLTATAALAALALKTNEASMQRLHPLAARALLEDARRPLPRTSVLVPELRWWSIARGGRAEPRGSHSTPIDEGSLELGREAAELGAPLLRAGFPWDPVRFAMPLEDGLVIARLPPAVPGSVVLTMLVADGLIFTAFAATLLRRRLVRPLQRLAAAARELADGDRGVRAPADGPRETWEVARAFNEMSEALELRTGALEKAVAELRDSNEQLREARVGLDRAERLAAVGTLAAGVAHEVGNPMGAMLAFVELARRDPGLTEEGREHLGRVQQEGQRVRSILRQLLDFSRPPRTERAPVDLLALAEETAGLVRAQRRYAGVSLEVTGEGATPLALADRNSVAQILLNLLLNAMHAVLGAASDAPRVEVHVRPVATRVRGDGDEAEVGRRRRLDAVECVVSDNGPGIPEADRGRIFDPFFTTKEPGEGTGLGLSNALRMAEELGGSLGLEDAGSGRGAAFVLRLPTAEAGPAEDGGGVRVRSREA